jgi:hypothetical protein
MHVVWLVPSDFVDDCDAIADSCTRFVESLLICSRVCGLCQGRPERASFTPMLLRITEVTRRLGWHRTTVWRQAQTVRGEHTRLAAVS